jgi:hypothetical protein
MREKTSELEIIVLTMTNVALTFVEMMMICSIIHRHGDLKSSTSGAVLTAVPIVPARRGLIILVGSCGCSS